MQITCANCGRSLPFIDEPPSFCSYCGKALAETRIEAPTPNAAEAPTLAPGPRLEIDSEAPENIGGYRLLRRLGQGGMGSVYEAEEAGSGRHVAVKLIGGQFAESTVAVERFRQEGKFASLVAHPRCVFILAADEQAGRPYIVMELMPGATLQDLVKAQGPLPPAEAVAKILDAIDGLQEAHRLGVIHRDVKPSNCFLDVDGRVKIGDFGLSKSLVADTALTQTGAFLGTPLYASPEQIRKEALDPQTDVYSVAATLYFLLTGHAPFESSDAAVTLARIVADPAPSLRNLRPELPQSLDRVVLRGLERDRSRRYRNLEEFRVALLPFAPGQLSIGGLGLRFAAYMIDALLLSPVSMLQAYLIFRIYTRLQTAAGRPFLISFLDTAVTMVYFGITEGLWGQSLGKRLLNLRVVRVGSSDPPGLLRSFLRVFVMCVCFSLGGIPSLFITPKQMIENPTLNLLGSCSQFTLLIIGFGLFFVTMRARNGYRGLHEFLSGTRVIRLPEIERPLLVESRRLEGRPMAAPARLGPYTVTGLLREQGAERVLLGEDAALERQVLLWVRPVAVPPVDAARRDNHRPTRLRWLAHGQEGEQQWDAFLASSGCPLPDLVARMGRVDWYHVRPLLAQLLQELLASCSEGSLPAPLVVSQVWLQARGQVQLVEWPLQAAEMDPAPGPPPSAVEQARNLLGDVAFLALEGALPDPDKPPNRIRVPIPLHASLILQRFLTPGEPQRRLECLEKDLADSRERPRLVSRYRRAAQQAIQAAFLLVGIIAMQIVGCMGNAMPHIGLPMENKERALVQRVLQERADQELAKALVNPDPLVQLHGLAQYQADLDQIARLQEASRNNDRELSARQQYASPFAQESAQMILESMKAPMAPRWEIRERYLRELPMSERWPGDHTLRREAALQDRHGWPPEVQYSIQNFLLVHILFWTIAWILWAFLFRGGANYWLAGLVLVRSNGRKALRLQCLWRALVVWIPFAGLLAASTCIDTAYWVQWRPERTGIAWELLLSWLLWGLAWALLFSFMILAIAFPRRTPLDWLSGTYCVPR